MKRGDKLENIKSQFSKYKKYIYYQGGIAT